MHHSSTAQLQLKSCSSSFAQHLPQAWRRLILWHKWKRTQKKKIDSLLNPLPATPRTGTERAGGVAELSLCCFSTRTKSCRWQQCPFHALHSTHIPSFAHGRGQTPYLPLEISLETWRDEWETERESETSWHLNLSIKSAKIHYLGFLLHHSLVILFQCLCPLSFCRFCNSLLCTCCLTEHHR